MSLDNFIEARDASLHENSNWKASEAQERTAFDILLAFNVMLSAAKLTLENLNDLQGGRIKFFRSAQIDESVSTVFEAGDHHPSTIRLQRLVHESSDGFPGDPVDGVLSFFVPQNVVQLPPRHHSGNEALLGSLLH